MTPKTLFTFCFLLIVFILTTTHSAQATGRVYLTAPKGSEVFVDNESAGIVDSSGHLLLQITPGFHQFDVIKQHEDATSPGGSFSRSMEVRSTGTGQLVVNFLAAPSESRIFTPLFPATIEYQRSFEEAWPREDITLLKHRGRLLIVGRNSSVVRENSLKPADCIIWFTEDGRRFVRHQPFYALGIDLQVVSFNNQLILISTSDGTPTLFTSDTGLSWQSNELPTDFTAGSGYTLAVTRQGLVYCGESVIYGRTYFMLWRSGDGKNWQLNSKIPRPLHTSPRIFKALCDEDELFLFTQGGGEANSCFQVINNQLRLVSDFLPWDGDYVGSPFKGYEEYCYSWRGSTYLSKDGFNWQVIPLQTGNNLAEFIACSTYPLREELNPSIEFMGRYWFLNKRPDQLDRFSLRQTPQYAMPATVTMMPFFTLDPAEIHGDYHQLEAEIQKIIPPPALSGGEAGIYAHHNIDEEEMTEFLELSDVPIDVCKNCSRGLALSAWVKIGLDQELQAAMANPEKLNQIAAENRLVIAFEQFGKDGEKLTDRTVKYAFEVDLFGKVYLSGDNQKDLEKMEEAKKTGVITAVDQVRQSMVQRMTQDRRFDFEVRKGVREGREVQAADLQRWKRYYIHFHPLFDQEHFSDKEEAQRYVVYAYPKQRTNPDTPPLTHQIDGLQLEKSLYPTKWSETSTIYLGPDTTYDEDGWVKTTVEAVSKELPYETR